MSTVTDWRYRWVLVGMGGKRLHRATSGPPSLGGTWEGYSVCGLRGEFYRPGLLNGLELARCRWCCDKLGLPQGVGVPHNDETLTAEQREV